MKQSLLIVSGPSDSNNKFGLGADTDDDDNEFWLFDNDNEEDDDIEDDDLYQDHEARQRFILLRLFTMRLPNISDQAKNGLIIAFSRSNSFGVLEHNALLDTLAHPVEGLSLSKYDELGFD
ncbi:hypothetical protein RhiirC2_797469 [Rhizophagus irregularis]|uniref:Uncharacterized protein n=1 Tax=Rhizophagus irregularis TaxID=588596 RepID=A0A2N1M821_9GLOM|nr:hypothetical protein RhiirC2_797469 [Rhizophagus irregularis]